MVLVVKNLPANARDARDTGSIPGSRRFPGGGHGNPTPIFLLGESHGQGSLAGYSHGVTKSQTWLKWLNMHTPVVLILKPLRSLSSFTFSLWSSIIWPLLTSVNLCPFVLYLFNHTGFWYVPNHIKVISILQAYVLHLLWLELFLLCSWVLDPPRNWSVTCSETLASSALSKGIFLAHNSLS